MISEVFARSFRKMRSGFVEMFLKTSNTLGRLHRVDISPHLSWVQ